MHMAVMGNIDNISLFCKTVPIMKALCVNKFIAGIFLVTVLVFSGCASSHNRDMLMAVTWQQNSGEYTALCHQAFNVGRAHLLALDAAGKKAVVLDIDETVLDNSPYAAWMIKTESPWSNESWEAWCFDARAEAVPGARDFTLFAAESGFEVFYVSNRPVSVTAATVRNLAELGFPMADEQHVLLMDKTSDKNLRFESIRKLGYEIVLHAGDNFDDFDGTIRKASNEERKSWGVENAASFGTYYIVLPNAAYGTFESALQSGYYSLPPEGKATARVESIRAWEP